MEAAQLSREPRFADNALWSAIQANQKELADAKLANAQALGMMSTQLATIQATVSNMTKLLENKQDREEDRTYRAWQDDRYSQVSPGQQQANHLNRNIDLQTLFMCGTLIVALMALFGVKL